MRDDEHRRFQGLAFQVEVTAEHEESEGGQLEAEDDGEGEEGESPSRKAFTSEG